MVEHIVKESGINATSKVAVLGTNVGSRKEVYKKMIEELTGNTQVILPDFFNTSQPLGRAPIDLKDIQLGATSRPIAQETLQDYIDKVKSNTLSSEDAKVFYERIVSYIKNQNPTDVILACTEIPLFLKSWSIEQNDGKETFKQIGEPNRDKLDLLQDLRKRFPDKKIIDTEEMMAEKISQNMIKHIKEQKLKDPEERRTHKKTP